MTIQAIPSLIEQCIKLTRKEGGHMKLLIGILFLLSTSVYSQTNSERLSQVKELNRIAFGSCNDQNDPQPLWNDIIKQDPDLFIWGGDIIYADWDPKSPIEKSYEKQFLQEGYAKLRETTPIIGVWDDHDYGINNGDGTYVAKKENQKHLLDFLEEPLESPRRIQEGAYTSYTFGEYPKKIKIILLDNRYFKNLDTEYPLLGKAQWEWLENELKDSDASLHFITAGLSIFSQILPYSDGWGRYPKEVIRMQDLLKKYHPKGAVFLTGDRHFASIFKRQGQLEFLSSGMTHTVARSTWSYISRRYPNTYFGLNYGQIDIAWEGDNPRLTLAIRSPSGRDIHRSIYQWKQSEWMLRN